MAWKKLLISSTVKLLLSSAAAAGAMIITKAAMAMTIEPFNAFIFNTSILNQMQLHPQDVTLILGIFPINPN
jgi:hypothetical protein